MGSILERLKELAKKIAQKEAEVKRYSLFGSARRACKADLAELKREYTLLLLIVRETEG